MNIKKFFKMNKNKNSVTLLTNKYEQNKLYAYNDAAIIIAENAGLPLNTGCCFESPLKISRCYVVFDMSESDKICKALKDAGIDVSIENVL